jgi:hypothetical protein
MAAQLWSFWDMVTLEARAFLNLLFAIEGMDQRLSVDQGHFDGDTMAPLLRDISVDIAAQCEKLRLQVAGDAAMSIPNLKSSYELKKTLTFVRDAMMIGLNRRKFFEPEPQYARYFENPKLFGDEVFAAFPSATDDIAEAGTCLALERSTACVMHLMRASEVALKALANAVGVGRQSDWGGYIREIYKELEKQVKAAGAATPNHQFYAEAAAQIDNVKRAWRNPSMHVDKSYSQPRAEEILLATKSLMSHLATRISE